jgi:TonB family protein
MFENLIESQPRKFKSFGQSLLSAVLHVVLAYGAIKATAGAAEQIKDILQDQTVMPPTEIPRDIPPVNLTERFDARDFSGKGVEGGIATGVVGGSGPVSTTETFVEAEVDDPVRAIEIPRPRYPPVLQQAGIAGSVDVQYVVDTLGRAEPSSFRVLRSTNKAFEDPAREAILAGRFKPARIRGQAVRQLVQQRISFNIGQ